MLDALPGGCLLLSKVVASYCCKWLLALPSKWLLALPSEWLLALLSKWLLALPSKWLLARRSAAEPAGALLPPLLPPLLHRA